MPFAEVDLEPGDDGTLVPDLPEGVTEFAVVAQPAPGRVVVETPQKVSSYKTRKAVAKKPEGARGGLAVPDDDPEFMSRARSREERAEEVRLGRPMTAAERKAPRAKPVTPAPPKKAAR